MTFPTKDSLQKMWVQMASRAASIKRQCTEFNTASLAGPVSASAVENVFADLGGFRAYMAATAGTSGLAAYVQAQYDDAELDIAAEYQTMIAAVDTALTWIASNVPQQDGYVLLDQWSGNGTISRRTFASATLAPLRTTLQGVVDAIE